MTYQKRENESDEDLIFRIASDKELIGTWQDVADILNKLLNKSYSESKYRKQFHHNSSIKTVTESNKTDDYYIRLKEKEDSVRKECFKLQTLNIERNRIDRNKARQELYYQYVGNTITTLPLPDFKPIYNQENTAGNVMEYLICLADIHYGANFVSENNEYSPTICQVRLEDLVTRLKIFCKVHGLSKIHVAGLGDTIQGIIHMTDLRVNDSSVVKATVEISRLIAQFLNELSRFVEISYYHVPFANHTQLRPLGSRPSELAEEDIEYIIGNYIKDLCTANSRIKVFLAEEGKQYINLPIGNHEIIAMHGHQIKNIETCIKDLSSMQRRFIDCVILGHFHNGKEIPTGEGVVNDTEVLVCPSFVGSDPYSDTLMRGSKAAVKILGFDELYGHTETYKIILN